ncbi:hypothetical protein BH24ACT5_BH24ACT5_20740 [soil metagenome]
MTNDDTTDAATTDELDLSPRPPARRPRASTRKRWLPMLVLALVVASGGVILVKFLGSAVDYYCNVDEIGQRNGCEAGRRLRIQGTVDEGSVESTSGTTSFIMSFRGQSVPVTYAGEPGGIFAECEPVVVHGRLDQDANVFHGDSIEVKHSNEYEAANPDRVCA